MLRYSRAPPTRTYHADRYDRADTIGQNLPIYVQTGSGLVNATDSGAWEAGLEPARPVEDDLLAAPLLGTPASGLPGR